MLICKNVFVNSRRTSMRLDRETWLSLGDICARENTNIHDLCSRIDSAKGKSGLSAATRLFVLLYFRHQLNKYEQTPFLMPMDYNPELILKRAS